MIVGITHTTHATNGKTNDDSASKKLTKNSMKAIRCQMDESTTSCVHTLVCYNLDPVS